MPLSEAGVRQAGEWIAAAQRCLVVCHIRPDGDAVGSLLGLGLALQAAGKQVQMVSEEGVPPACRGLVGVEQVRRSAQGEFDLIIVVDSSDLERTGSVLAGSRQPDICIDHHATNSMFAKINLVDIKAVAAAEMIAALLPAWGLTITQGVAAALLTGIVTDTIGFRTANVTPHALRLSAGLMEAGADLAEIYRRSLVDRSFEALRLWGEGLSRLERSGRLVWTTLALEDRQVAGYPGRDDADLVNLLSAVEGADIAMIFIEQPNGRVKVSWRAQPGFDVSQIALMLGGGGHAAASGAELTGSLSNVRDTVLELTRPLLNGGHRVQS
jgi:phosphoesterase RecJ-like protein